MGYRVVTRTVDQPAAGQEWSIVPSTSDRVKILALTALYTASSATASRVPGLVLKDQTGTEYWSTDANAALAATVAAWFSFAPTTAAVVDQAEFSSERGNLPFPPLWLEPGDSISSSTVAIASGDQWSNIAYRAIIGDYWEREEEMLAVANALWAASGS